MRNKLFTFFTKDDKRLKDDLDSFIGDSILDAMKHQVTSIPVPRLGGYVFNWNASKTIDLYEHDILNKKTISIILTQSFKKVIDLDKYNNLEWEAQTHIKETVAHTLLIASQSSSAQVPMYAQNQDREIILETMLSIKGISVSCLRYLQEPNAGSFDIATHETLNLVFPDLFFKHELLENKIVEALIQYAHQFKDPKAFLLINENGAKYPHYLAIVADNVAKHQAYVFKGTPFATAPDEICGIIADYCKPW